MSYCWYCRTYNTCDKKGCAWNSGKVCKDRDTVLVVNQCKSEDGKPHYHTFMDQSVRYGCLNFSHEIDINFTMINGKIEFQGGQEMNCGGDWIWPKNESDQFESEHPGLLAKIEKAMNEGNVRYVRGSYTMDNNKK